MKWSCRRISTLLAVVLLVLLEVAAGVEHGPSQHAPTNVDDTSPAISHPDDAAVGENDLEFYKRLYDFGLGKRAYSYVSEYKRLPVYNFGLGKRGRQYSFGLGKRPADYDEYYVEDEEETSPDDEELNEDLESENSVDKRGRQYSFGLGKRVRPYSFGLGKRAQGQQQLYSFGLGKKAERPHAMYSFGLGKRADGRLYAFGLGKRPAEEDKRASGRFSFGLGKRVNDEDEEDDTVDEGKRSQHRFSFGLGKREVSQKELEAVKEEERQKQPAKDEGHHIAKRSLRYPFAIGKRGEMDWGSDDGFDDNRVPSYARLSRRPYNFGLGKRIPMYDFGLGKRSESD